MVPAPIEQCANFKVFEEEACPLKCCVVPTGNYFHETSDISDFIPLFDLALECSKILRNYKISRHDDPSQKPFFKVPRFSGKILILMNICLRPSRLNFLFP